MLGDAGVLVAKMQDEGSRTEQPLTHIEITNLYKEELGFTAKDLFVLVREDTPHPSNTKNQKHVRKNHSYSMVYVPDEELTP